MKQLLLFLTFVLTTSQLNAQSLVEYNEKRINTDNKLMLTLGSWAIANIGVSSYGWATTDYDAKYFHQMNVAWGIVNLGIALPSYIRTFKTDASSFNFERTYKRQMSSERLYLFNSALDIAYITGGLFLRQRAFNDKKNYHRFMGWGNSIIMQGSFLLLFDLTATIIHNRHRKKDLEGFWSNLETSDTGIGIKYNLN